MYRNRISLSVALYFGRYRALAWNFSQTIQPHRDDEPSRTIRSRGDETGTRTTERSHV